MSSECAAISSILIVASFCSEESNYNVQQKMLSFNETGNKKWNGWRPQIQFLKLNVLSYIYSVSMLAEFVHDGWRPQINL